MKDKLQFKTQPEEYEIIYSKGDVVALKHNYKRYISPFFFAVLLKDLHHNSDAFLEDHMGFRRLEQSGGDEEKGEQAKVDNFSGPIRFEAGRSRSGRPTTRYVR